MDDQNNFTPVTPVVPPMPEMPMSGPITTSTTTSTPTSTTTSTTTTTPTTPDLSPVLPMAPEVEWPGSKPKSKLPQILGGIAAIILVVGVATAAYFVSNKISGRQAVAPTAPESEPLAKGGDNTERNKKACEEANCGPNEVCKGEGNCVWQKPEGEENIPGYKCTDTNCPAPEFYCSSASNCLDSPGYKGGVKITAAPTKAPTATPTSAICTEGATSCADNHKYVCSGGKWTAAGPCVTATGIPTPPMVTCPNPKRCADGTTVDLCRQSCPTTPPIGGPIVTPKPTKKPGNPPEPPVVSCKEQCPGGDGVLRSCTPPEADGSSNDSLCNSAGRVEVCGGSNYCCPSTGGTWTTDMTACSTTMTVTAGACYDVVLFAKIDGVYSTTPMTVAQKTSLHIGDMIRIAITGSKADLKARFRVYINEMVEPTGNTASPEWRLGQTFSGANHKTTFYSDYEIKSAGNYKFEGQVTTEP